MGYNITVLYEDKYSDAAWTAETGMDPGYGETLGEYDSEDDGLADLRADTVLVIESGETSAYTRKYERDGYSYELVDE